MYTAAGATSILDLMLALVEEDLGSELALRVAQGKVMFLRRPASQSQFSVQLTALKTGERPFATSYPTSRKTPVPTLRSSGSANSPL